MLLFEFCCCDFCYGGMEIFGLTAFHLNILALSVELLLFCLNSCVSRPILGGNVQMNNFLETICQFGRQNLEELCSGRGKSGKFECL